MAYYGDRIEEMFANGIKPKKIAESLGCSINTVYHYTCRRTNNRLDGESLRSRQLYRKWYRHSNRGEWFGWDEFITWINNQTKCYITGRVIDISKIESWQIDHIIPKSKGGAMTLDNLAVVCKEANYAKWDMSYDELLLLCKEILKNKGFIVI